MSEKKTKEIELSIQMTAFVDNYVTNRFNGTQAAISAGYSENSARSIACDLLKRPDVKAEIAKRLTESRKGKEELMELVLTQWEAVVMVTIDMFIEKVMKQGKRKGEIIWKDPKDWTQAMKNAVSGFKYDRFGTMSIELNGKQAAADSLAKHLGIYADTVDKDKNKGANVVIMLPDNGRDAKQ